MTRSRSDARGAAAERPAPLARAVRALALLLFAWQALVVQAHWHGGARPVEVSATGAAQASTERRQPAEPVNCPICREVAHAGAFLAPDPIAPVFAPAAAPLLAVAALPVLLHASRSHAWRSRAPPVSLPF